MPGLTPIIYQIVGIYGRAYVANSGGNSVSVIDTNTNTVIATIAVGTAPRGVAVSLDASRVYVANQTTNNVSVINATTNTVIATIAVGTAPRGIAVIPDGSRVYVANATTNNISVINTATNTVIATITVGTGPRGVAVSPDGARVYVANRSTNNVSVISTATNTVTNTVNVTFAPSNVTDAKGIIVNSTSTKVYVAMGGTSGGGSIVVIDAGTLATSTLVGQLGTSDITITPDNLFLYYVYYNVGGIGVKETDITLNINVSTIATGSNDGAIAINPTGTRVYVPNIGSDNVSVIDTATNTITATIAVGDQPYGIAVI